MSGITADNPYRASGVIAAAAAGGLSWQDVVTGSTLTAEAGKAYWINTTSNTCTITLPASASNGDEMIFADFDRTWGTNGIIIDSNGLNYQGEDDSFDVEYSTDGQTVKIVYSDATNGWIPILDEAVADAPTKGNDNGLFAFGQASAPPPYYNVSNKVSNTGVVATDTSGVGTARGEGVAGCEYGGDKGIIGFGYTGSRTGVTNLVSNTGVVGTDVSAVGTARQNLSACDYGGDKGIFAYGNDGSADNTSNLVSNTGVVATDVTGVGTARSHLAACEYGGDKGIFGYGGGTMSMTNLVSNTGVVGTDVTGVGSGREGLGACSYGGDKGIFSNTATNVTNLVSNTGVVATDVAGVGTAKGATAGTQYGFDKGIFAYGSISGPAVTAISNLISNTGVQAADVSGVGQTRKYHASCSYN
jgi:hypothetical protein|tara:strand:+ start:1150 stop:2397 length:1248 start_codon:yes stop_codon:yes gene_type:complete